ncbi:MAG: ATP-binding cassette domain-containing protein [Bacteroidota bacterium]|nr:ATP-binding cassette domain-containing protein [Bacteroidota bacterium]
MVEIKNIEKSFGSNKVLNNVSAVFETGKINCIIGKSGSGKTVLLKTIVGLETPEVGSVIYDNREFKGRKQKKEIRKEIGMVFQGGALFDSLSILENLIFPLDMFTEMTYNQKTERASYCLDRVGLENVEELYPADLSGGMQKRAAIARAIVNKPKYLFCDEPNSGLDPVTAGKIDKLIKDIVSEMEVTTIINTHDINSVLNIGDSVLFLANGEKVWEGQPKDILKTDIYDLKDFIKPFISKKI